MKKFLLLIAALCALVVVSCTNNEETVDLFLKQNEIQNEASTRITFDGYEEFGKYFDAIKNDEQNTVITRSFSEIEDSENPEGISIVKKFLEYTSMGKIFNSENEFQIGDTIIKLGNDGYSIYKISINKYKDAIPLIKSSREITNNLNQYRKKSDFDYELSEGVVLWYSGEPLIQSFPIETSIDNEIELRNGGPLVPYQVLPKFWKSHNFFFGGCGPEITYKELQNGQYKDKNTNLRMNWYTIEIIFSDTDLKKFLFPMGLYTYIGTGSKSDTGSYDKKTFAEMVGINLGGYKYYLIGGSIIGSAQNSNGSWVSATIYPLQ